MAFSFNVAFDAMVESPNIVAVLVAVVSLNILFYIVIGLITYLCFLVSVLLSLFAEGNVTL